MEVSGRVIEGDSLIETVIELRILLLRSCLAFSTAGVRQCGPNDELSLVQY